MHQPVPLVLDIEGTLCPISFVHDVLFPYALQRAHAEIPTLQFPLDAARSELEHHLAQFPAEHRGSASALLAHIEDLVARDVKAPYLKGLQGYLWTSGYASGEITAPVYDDAVAAIRRWAAVSRVYIYSSGSVAAQKLLFEHTSAGDLRPYLSGYFDTVNAGPKVEAQSYAKIVHETGEPALRFFSDNPREIDAASAAGWDTVFVVRPGNPPYADYKPPGPTVTTFEGL